jgi:hypothetical protein
VRSSEWRVSWLPATMVRTSQAPATEDMQETPLSMTAFSPREIVSELDRHIVGQK